MWTFGRKKNQGADWRHQFNSEGNVVLISSYPKRFNRTSEDSKGVSFYVERLAPPLGAHLAFQGRRLIILSESLETEGICIENQLLVFPSWKRNAITCFLRIFWTLCSKLPKPRLILIHFEFNLFGGAATTALLPLFILALRMSGRRPCLMLHHVVNDLAAIRIHAGLEKKPFRFALYRRFCPRFYWLLLKLTPCVAVHEPALQDALAKIDGRRTMVIPVGCSNPSAPPKYREARKALLFKDEEIILLCFGFLAHYKGSDWIAVEVAAYAKKYPETRLRLILAGGESPNYGGQPHYAKFLSEVRSTAAACSGHIEVTGFVPDDRVPLYLTSADLVVFPYRTQMSASGPLSLALSFGCPFLLSDALRGSLAAEDFRRALKDSGLEATDLTFRLSPGELIPKVLAVTRDRARLKAMRRMSHAVARNRNWSFVAKEYLNLIDAHPSHCEINVPIRNAAFVGADR